LRPGETLNLAPPSSLVPAGDAQLQKVFSVVQALRPRDLLARPLTRTTATSTERLSGAKVFQFPNPAVLKIDHCSISEMSVQVHDSGGWELSLRADQNPLDAPPEKKVTTIEDRQLYTDHLQRNQFFVRVQCYANYGRAGRSGLLGKPLVIPLEVEPFFVQKGVPLALVVPGYSSKVKANYASIDRAEIEFYYRTE
jgi:hypothetical protein